MQQTVTDNILRDQASQSHLGTEQTERGPGSPKKSKRLSQSLARNYAKKFKGPGSSSVGGLGLGVTYGDTSVPSFQGSMSSAQLNIPPFLSQRTEKEGDAWSFRHALTQPSGIRSHKMPSDPNNLNKVKFYQEGHGHGDLGFNMETELTCRGKRATTASKLQFQRQQMINNLSKSNNDVPSGSSQAGISQAPPSET
ncbi:uncharacterized protein LOC126671170 isoform X2 [Mercurialis annua]|nr:uncharacterized protein LOC126671170 isoform X2 [Mercurialis annua]